MHQNNFLPNNWVNANSLSPNSKNMGTLPSSFKALTLFFFILFCLIENLKATAKVELFTSNCTAGANYIEFQINITNTSTAGETIYINVPGTWRIYHGAGIVPAGTNTFTFAYVPGTCDPMLSPLYATLGTTYNVSYTAATRLMQATYANSILGNSAAAQNAPLLAGQTINLGKFRLTITNKNFVSNANGALSWAGTTSSITAYIGTSTTTTAFNTSTNRTLGSMCSMTTPCAATSSTETISSCGSYTWHGNTYTTSNITATWVTTNAGGCDSTVTLNLTINQSSTSTTTQTATGSYTWNGTTYTSSGTYTFTGTNAAGCDSVATLILTINSCSPSSSIETLTACDSLLWHGTMYNSSNNTATWTGTNAAGCDSVVTLNLTINNATSSTETHTACDSYTWHGTTYTNSGTYSWTGVNAANCDSVVTLNLTINNATSSTETASACGSYVWHGTTYTTSGAKTFTTTNAAGCDSVVTLNLTINVSTTSTTTQTATGSYTWNGTTYSASGTYTFTGTNAAGCDSVATLILTIHTICVPTSSTETITACSSYVWHGNTYTTSGIRTWTGINAGGCDSVVTLNLTIQKIVPVAPTSITQTLVSNNCGVRVYRFKASTVAAGLQYYWYLPTSIGGVSGVTLDSGSLWGQTIRLSFVSNNASLVTDSIKAVSYNGCSSRVVAKKIIQLAIEPPLAPTSIKIDSVQPTICGARKYRFTAPNLTAATAGNGAATGWNWVFTGALGASATIDSGNSSSRVIVVSFSSNAAAVVGDSVKVRYTSNCGYSKWKAAKLYNKVLLKPATPSSIFITALSTNVCGNRVYRFSAPALPSASFTEVTAITAATGYLWSFVGSFGSNAVIDSGTINSRKIRVVFTSNDAAGIGDSVRLAYLSSCGTTANKSIKLPIPAKTGCPSSLKTDMKTTDLDKSLHLQISPNPSSDKFKLQITGTTADSKATAVIMDIQGRIVKTYSFNSNTSLDFGNDLMPGTYLIKVTAGREAKVMKVVKQ